MSHSAILIIPLCDPPPSIRHLRQNLSMLGRLIRARRISHLVRSPTVSPCWNFRLPTFRPPINLRQRLLPDLRARRVSKRHWPCRLCTRPMAMGQMGPGPHSRSMEFRLLGCHLMGSHLMVPCNLTKSRPSRQNRAWTIIMPS